MPYESAKGNTRGRRGVCAEGVMCRKEHVQYRACADRGKIRREGHSNPCVDEGPLLC